MWVLMDALWAALGVSIVVGAGTARVALDASERKPLEREGR